jgi:uncharacterized protein (DUF58 family)
MSSEAPSSRFLDLRAMAALEHMRFVTRHRIEGAYSGRHLSRQKGGAGEFVDYREYVEGEDLRRLDWKVLARTGRAYTRLYQDETNLMCLLCIDASGSMEFSGTAGRGTSSPAGGNGGPTGSKLEYAQYLATALSHVITRQQDQVGLGLVADSLQEYVEPGSTRPHAARVQERIEGIRTARVTRLGEGLRELFERVSRRGVLLVMSDFLVDDLDDAWRSIRLFRHRHWEVVALHLVHPEEERLPAGLAYRFVGLEGEGHTDCTPAEIARQYEERFAQHAAMVRALALATGCDYRRVSTAVPYLQTLSGFLVERSG